MLQEIAIILSYPPELGGKALFLTTKSKNLAGEVKLVYTWKLQASWLVSIVLKNVMFTSRGKYKPQTYPEVNFEATTMTSLTKCALWYNNFMNVMRLTKQFLIGPKAYSKR